MAASPPVSAPMSAPSSPEGPTRRDFLYLVTGATGAIGVAAAVWPFADSLNPAADTRALASIDVDLSPIAVGQAITVVWRNKPVFIRHRNPSEIAAARAVAVEQLPDPQRDEARAPHEQWLIVVGVCTHLGCVPLGQRATESHGDYGGWFCPCHGSHYDTSGRIRKGPAPANLVVPPYEFLTDTSIRLG